MPNKGRSSSFLRLGSVVGALILTSVMLFGGPMFTLPPTHAVAQSNIAKVDLVPDYESEPDLAGLLETTKRIRMSEAIPGLAIGSADYPAFGVRLHVFDFAQAHFTLRVVEQKFETGNRAADYLDDENDVFLINGGFFERAYDATLSPSGLLIMKGVAVSKEYQRAGSGVIYSDADGVAIAYRKQLEDHSQIENAVQVGPILVDPGGQKGIYKNSFDRFNRSTICLRGDLFPAFVVEGGISLFQFADLLSLAVIDGGFGCNIAINLDGGPSTQAVLRAGRAWRDIPGGTTVQNALVVSKTIER